MSEDTKARGEKWKKRKREEKEKEKEYQEKKKKKEGDEHAASGVARRCTVASPVASLVSLVFSPVTSVTRHHLICE